MPAYRDVPENTRRSRRLSCQEPKCYDDDGFEVFNGSEAPFRFPSEPVFAEPEPMSTDTSASESPSPPSPEPFLSPSPSPSPPPSRSSRRHEPYRSSHSKRKGKDHIPRPPNSFMCFRSQFWVEEKDRPTHEKDHRQVSRIAGNAWRMLTQEEREPYKEMAQQRKMEHAAQYPGYKYAPSSRKSDKPRKKATRDSRAEKAKCDKIVEELFPIIQKSDLDTLIVMSPEPEAALSLPTSPPSTPFDSSNDEFVDPAALSNDDEVVGPDVTVSSGDNELGLEFVPTEEIPPLQLSPARESESPFLYSEEGQAENSYNWNSVDPQLGFPGPIEPFSSVIPLFDDLDFTSQTLSFLPSSPLSPLYSPDELMPGLERFRDDLYHNELQRLNGNPIAPDDSPANSSCSYFDKNDSLKDYVHGIFD